MSEIEQTYSDSYQDNYEIDYSFGIVHYKFTGEIVLVNQDTGEKFLLSDYEEAEKVANLILQLVKKNEIQPANPGQS